MSQTRILNDEAYVAIEGSDDLASRRKLLQLIMDEAEIDSHIVNVGYWAETGFTPGNIIHARGDLSIHRLCVYIANWIGLLNQHKQVMTFHVKKDGPDRFFQFKMRAPLEEANDKLQKISRDYYLFRGGPITYVYVWSPEGVEHPLLKYATSVHRGFTIKRGVDDVSEGNTTVEAFDSSRDAYRRKLQWYDEHYGDHINAAKIHVEGDADKSQQVYILPR